MPLVSVVIPSYNHGRFIAESIESVLNQTFRDFELIIVDDASTDDTLEVIRRYKDPRIKTKFLERNQGGAFANSEGVRMASGKYIAVLSSDDKFFPDKLEKQVRFLEENPGIAAVFGLPEFIDETGDAVSSGHVLVKVFNVENRSRHQWLRYFLNNGNCLCHPTVLIRRSVYDDVGLYEPYLFQLPDWDLWIRVCLKYEIHVLREPLIQFRILSGKQENASAPNRQNWVLNQNEASHIFRHYRKLTDSVEVRKVFPEAAKFSRGSDDAKYLLARVALENELLPVRHFGMSILYELFSEPESALRITEKYGFTHLDLMRMAREINCWVPDPGLESNLLYIVLRKAYQVGKKGTNSLLRAVRNSDFSECEEGKT